MKLSKALARWVALEGVDTVFALMGDGNLQFVGELAAAGQVEVMHGRHENALLTMAHGYAAMGGDVGVCTVTCGPGIAQVTTALTAAVRAGVPVVLLAGETPLGSAFHYQSFDPSGMFASAGARHVRILAAERAQAQVREAFFTARSLRTPVVVTIPVDVQQQEVPDSVYQPSTDWLVPDQASSPDPEALAAVVDAVLEAERPCVLAGRGAVESGAAAAIGELTAWLGAVGATTLPAQGLLDELDPRLVVGVAGGFASESARALLRSADLVIAFGASLGQFTTERGQLFEGATVVQVDTDPRGHHEGRYVADLYLRSDARLAADLILAEAQARRPPRAPWCSDARTEPERLLGGAGDSEYRTAPDAFVSALRAGIPRDARVVVGGGHFWSFVLPDFRVVRPDDLFITADFGAIAQAVPFAVGGSATARQRPLFVIEGDGGLLMHVQEIETAVRYGVSCCVVVMNDGGYGAEKHMLAGGGLAGETADFGYVDIAAVAAAFGATSAVVTTAEELQHLVAGYGPRDGLMVIDVRYSSGWISPSYQRMFFGSSGH